MDRSSALRNSEQSTGIARESSRYDLRSGRSARGSSIPLVSITRSWYRAASRAGSGAMTVICFGKLTSGARPLFTAANIVRSQSVGLSPTLAWCQNSVLVRCQSFSRLKTSDANASELRPSTNSSMGSMVTRLLSALLPWRFGSPDMFRRALSISFETPRDSPSRPLSSPREESTPAHRSLTAIAISSSLWGVTIRPDLFGS